MTFTTTGIGFSLLALGLAFCGLYFFRAFQKIGGSRAGRKIGILLSSVFFSNSVTVGIIGIGTFFFANDSEALYKLLAISNVPLAITGALAIYTVFFILFPRISPWPAVGFTALLGVSVIIATIITHPLPFLTAGGGLEFNLSRGVSILLAYLLFIVTGSSFTIFAHAFLHARSRDVRIISLGLTVLALIGIVNTFIRYLLPGNAVYGGSRIQFYDTAHAFMGIIFAGIFILLPIISGKTTRA